MASTNPTPPRLARRFLRWFLKSDLAEEVEGDLEEQFFQKLEQSGRRKANWNYRFQVLHYIRPFALRPTLFTSLNPFFMLRHNFKISVRSLWKDRGFSTIKLSSLALGMTVTLLIGLWVHDELQFNWYHDNYDRIARVMQHRERGDEIATTWSTQLPLADELRAKYGQDFERVATTTFRKELVLGYGNEQFNQGGYFTDREGPEMLSLQMVSGDINGLDDPAAIFISQTLSENLFGQDDPMGMSFDLGNGQSATVKGVYAQIPENSDYADADFFGSMALYLDLNAWMKTMANPWGYSGFNTLVQLAPQTDLEAQSRKIKDVILNNVTHDETAFESKPVTFLHPMSDWRLHTQFKNGVNVGGEITTVRLYGLIGLITLVLACINFINLTTARSEKRSVEVGVRKTMGSGRRQLIRQFFFESFLIAGGAFVLSVVLSFLLLPFFNGIADKHLNVPVGSPLFWIAGLAFTALTGILAGSYPAFYLSGLHPIKALKGSFRIGRTAALPRKLLVVTQFTVSTVLIIGTVIIFQQIRHAQDRPIGYDQDELLTIYPKAGEIGHHFNLIREELLQKRLVENITRTSSPITDNWGTWGNWNWPGKDPEQVVLFPKINITTDYGETVAWQFVAGRDFSPDMKTDTAAFIINEAAAAFMGFDEPVGKLVQLEDKTYEVIGVVKNVLTDSPFQSVEPIFYALDDSYGDILIARLDAQTPANTAMKQVKEVIEKHVPTAVLEFSFADEEFAGKFKQEQQTGRLAAVFAIMAIFISCLGLLGLSAYMAEKRTKEIGIRKVLGASVFQLWHLLSGEFGRLVFISCLFALPIAYYYSSKWLQNFDYRINISWKVLVFVGIGTLLLTLMTVSFQAIRAAVANPVESLRSE